jgi:hypothetical protein
MITITATKLCGKFYSVPYHYYTIDLFSYHVHHFLATSAGLIYCVYALDRIVYFFEHVSPKTAARAARSLR